MKNLRKLALLLIAAVLVFSVCGAVFAEESADATPDPNDTTTVGATEPAATEAAAETKPDPTYKVYDENGKEVMDMSGLGCLGGSVNLYIKHGYKVVIGYVDGSKMKETEDELIADVQTDNSAVTRDHNTVVFPASDTPYKVTITVVYPKAEKGTVDLTLSVKRFNLSLPDIIVAFVAVYVLINAITGKGALFTDEFIKDDKKELFKKIMRILACVTGVMFLTAAVLSICFSYLGWVKVLRYVLFGVGLASLITIMIVNARFTDKEKRQKAQQTSLTGGPTSSAAAFEFDENEPTVDEVLAEIERKKNENSEN